MNVKKLLKKYNEMPIAVKATIWFIFCSTLQKCISLLTTPIFTRIMTTEQYGQYTVYNSWLQTFTILTTLRLNWGVFSKGMSKYKTDRDGYTSTMQSITFILTVICFVLYLLFREQINALTELPTFIMVAIFAELLVTPAIDFWTIRKRFDYIYKPIVFRTMLMVVLNAALGVIAVMLAEEKGYARIMTCVIVNICFGAVLFVYNLKKGKTIFKWEYAKFAISFNLPLLLHYCSQYVLDQFGKIMIQKIVSIAAAGIYGIAYNTGMLMKIVTQNINNGLVPWQYEKLENREIKQLDDVLFMVYALVGACALALALFAPEIMMILSDERYYQAVYAIPPIAVGMYFLFMYTTFANVEFFFDKNKFAMYISLAVAALNIIMNYFGVKIFGYLAVAYVSLICYIAFAFGHYVYMTKSIKKELKISHVFNTKRIMLLSVTVVCAGLGVILLYGNRILRYGVIITALIVLFVFRDKVLRILKMIMSSKNVK